MWNAIQCAVQGRGHAKTDTPCQDKTYVLVSDEANVVALADGAGSAKMSHYGAEYVTNYICKKLLQDFDIYFSEEDGAVIKRKIINDLLTGLNQIATEHECEVKDLASTLLVAAVKDGKYILIHIGDGVIGYLKNSELKIASQPENGEFVNTTVFVTSKDVLQTMKILKGKLCTINGFVLMSDGTEASLYNKREKTLAPVLRRLMKLSQIMDSSCLENEIRKSFDGVIKEATTDDCSIVLLVEEDYSFRGYNELSKTEKGELLGFSVNNQDRKRCKRYDDILHFLLVPSALAEVSRRLHLKKKYSIRHLEYLMERNLIVKNNGFYQTAIVMKKD